LTPSPSDADEVLHEAILRMFRGFDALRACDEVKAWLLTIVKNCHFTTQMQQRRGAFESLREEHALQMMRL
jgi:DNA-directed RNA polymerase specialized sigma24 family protein